MNRQPISDEAAAAFELHRAEVAARRAMRPRIASAGVEALRRLMHVAQGDTGQSRKVARFLLGLYNGSRFPFDLTDLRGLDYALHDDCVDLLRMDHSPEREVYCYFERGGELFEQLAADWGLSHPPKDEAGSDR